MNAQRGLSPYSECIARIAASISAGKFAVWCGSGISVPSGLPIVEPFINELLQIIPLEDQEKKLIASLVPNHTPFEKFMECLFETMSVAEKTTFLSEFFSIGTPAIGHHFIVALVKRGWIQTIATTNFDRHLEGALENKIVKFETWQDPEKLDDIHWDIPAVRLLKLHGGIDGETDLGVTLRRVGAGGFGQYLKTPLTHLLPNESHAGILFLGYSFSDKFDIMPLMKERALEHCQLEIVVIEHKNQDEKRLMTMDEVRHHPVPQFDSVTIIEGHTETIVRDLSAQLGVLAELGVPEHENANSAKAKKPKWREFLSRFFSDQEQATKGASPAFLSGSLLVMIKAYPQAIGHLQKSVMLADEFGEDVWRWATRDKLAEAHLAVGDVFSAKRVLDEAVKHAPRNHANAVQDTILSRRALLYEKIGGACFTQAEDLYKKAYQMVVQDSDLLRAVPHLSGMGTTWMKLGDLDVAQGLLDEAWKRVEGSGDLFRRAEVCGNLGSLACVARDYPTALKWYAQALNESTACGDLISVATHHMNLGIVNARKKENAEALCFLKRAKEEFIQILGPDEAARDPRVVQLEEYVEIIKGRMDAKRSGGSSSGVTSDPAEKQAMSEREKERGEIYARMEDVKDELPDETYNRLRQRFEDLFELEDEEPIRVSPGSARQLLQFLRNDRRLRCPGILITDRRNIKAIWQASESQIFWIEFEPNGDVTYLAFVPNIRRSDGIERTSALSTTDDVLDRAREIGALAWMRS